MTRRKPVTLNEHSETVEQIKRNLIRDKKIKRKIKRQKFTKRVLILLVISLITYGLYLFDQSPISRFATIKVSGNQYYSESDIIEMSGVEKGSRMITNLPFMIKGRLKNLPLVDKAKVNVYYNKGYLSLDIKEVKAVAYSKDERIKIYFSNGEVVNAEGSTFNMIAQLPLLNGFDSANIDKDFLLELGKLPDESYQAISEIYSTPSELEPSAMKMVMNDEYFVYLSIETLPMLRQYATLVNGAQESNKCIDMIDYGPNESSQTAIVRRCE